MLHSKLKYFMHYYLIFQSVSFEKILAENISAPLIYNSIPNKSILLLNDLKSHLSSWKLPEALLLLIFLFLFGFKR